MWRYRLGGVLVQTTIFCKDICIHLALPLGE